jgi:prepilin-type N-terminal cleavage/methylation domain-containing protein
MRRTKHTRRCTTDRREPAQRGFTLLELLVAMTILSIMGAALFTMFSESSRTYERTQARTEQFLAAREALGLMVTELKEAIVDPNASPSPIAPGAQFYMFDKGSDDPGWRTHVQDRSSQIYFVAPTEARPTNAHQDVCVIGYWVYDDPTDNNPPALMRYCLADNNRSEWSELDPRKNIQSQECGVNVAQLTFEWWDASQSPSDQARWDPSDSKLRHWDSTDTSEPTQLYQLPPAVRITLVVWDPTLPVNADPTDPEVRKHLRTFTTVVRLDNAQH